MKEYLELVGHLTAEGLVTMVDILPEQSHDNNLKHEVCNGNVEQTEQEKPRLAEIEGQQAIPENDW